MACSSPTRNIHRKGRTIGRYMRCNVDREVSSLEGGGVTPYNGLYGEAPPKGVPFSGFRYIKG